MDELIEALQIFKKYTNEKYPCWCAHDEFHICVEPEEVSDEDIEKLEELGFEPDEETNDFCSFKYGSC